MFLFKYKYIGVILIVLCSFYAYGDGKLEVSGSKSMGIVDGGSTYAKLTLNPKNSLSYTLLGQQSYKGKSTASMLQGELIVAKLVTLGVSSISDSNLPNTNRANEIHLGLNFNGGGILSAARNETIKQNKRVTTDLLTYRVNTVYNVNVDMRAVQTKKEDGTQTDVAFSATYKF